MYREGNLYAGGPGCGERPMRVRVRGDQAVAIDNHPLIHVSCKIFPYPVHFASSVAGRGRSRGMPMLQPAQAGGWEAARRIPPVSAHVPLSPPATSGVK